LITGKYKIITFEEYILIALYANRVVGIYPEIKDPIFINQHVSILYSGKLRRTFVYLRNNVVTLSAEALIKPVHHMNMI
jgi:hypothetical protein